MIKEKNEDLSSHGVSCEYMHVLIKYQIVNGERKGCMDDLFPYFLPWNFFHLFFQFFYYDLFLLFFPDNL